MIAGIPIPVVVLALLSAACTITGIVLYLWERRRR